jgi:hypothetical protein
MRIGTWEIHARLIDHNRDPAWVGPWLGLRHHESAGFLFDTHLQYQRRPADGCQGWVAGFALSKYSQSRNRPLLCIGRNWWSKQSQRSQRLYAQRMGWR